MHVVQTEKAVKRQEALTRGVGDNVMKHHVNAIIDDDLWQVVKQEKLQEGDFAVESSMSCGGSHWCRSTLDFEHRSTYFNQNQSTGSPEPRSMTPTELTASCNAVRTRGVRNKTPTSAQPYLCQYRSAHWSWHRSTKSDRHRSTTSSAN